MVRNFLLIFSVIFLSFNSLFAQEENSEKTETPLKRNKIGLFTGNTLIHGVQNTQTGKEQYVLAPTIGIDYEFWLNHKWAIGTYNEVSFLSIEVEQDEEDFIERENGLLFSGVLVYEIVPRWSVFAGTGVETDGSESLWIRYFGTEYAFIQNDDWEVAVACGYINKELYDAFTFGFVIGRRFGKPIPSKHHH